MLTLNFRFNRACMSPGERTAHLMEKQIPPLSAICFIGDVNPPKESIAKSYWIPSSSPGWTTRGLIWYESGEGIHPPSNVEVDKIFHLVLRIFIYTRKFPISLASILQVTAVFWWNNYALSYFYSIISPTYLSYFWSLFLPAVKIQGLLFIRAFSGVVRGGERRNVSPPPRNRKN